MRCSHCNLLLVAKNECAPASIIESRPSPPDEGFALFSVELDIIFPWTGTPDCARHVPYTVSANLTGNDLRLLRLHTDIAPQPICTRTIPAGSMSRAVARFLSKKSLCSPLPTSGSTARACWALKDIPSMADSPLASERYDFFRLLTVSYLRMAANPLRDWPILSGPRITTRPIRSSDGGTLPLSAANVEKPASFIRSGPARCICPATPLALAPNRKPP